MAHKPFAEQLDEEHANKLVKSYLEKIRKSRVRIEIPVDEMRFIGQYATTPEKKTLAAHLTQPQAEKDYLGHRFTWRSMWNSLIRRIGVRPPTV